jgi:hypothetical protein
MQFWQKGQPVAPVLPRNVWATGTVGSRGSSTPGLTLKDYFAKHTRTHKNHKNTNVELLLSTVKYSYWC